MFKKHYQDELRYLKEMGAEFCRNNSEIAQFLDGSDPDAERLLEGFAFLSANIRQKLDDEIPEFTQGLLQLMWPQYLQPVPAAAILEFEPFLAQLRASKTVDRGIEVQSVPVEIQDGPLEGRTSCTFQTSFDVPLNPVTIDSVRLDTAAIGQSRLDVGLRVHNEVPTSALSLESLRIFLHDAADAGVDFALYLHLCRHVTEARVIVEGSNGEPDRTWPISIEPAGFSVRESLTPGETREASGHRLLHEYFTFPKKFLFVEVIGLEQLRELEAVSGLRLEITFDRELEGTLRPEKEHLRLHCTPIVNVFNHDGSPISADRARGEYLLRPAGVNPFHYEIYSIDEVLCYATGDADARPVLPFYAFPETAGKPDQLRYQPRFRTSVIDDRGECYLALANAEGGPAHLSEGTITTTLSCTNRRLPAGLRIGDIHVPTEQSPEFVKFANITNPSDSCPAKIDDGLLWQSISQQALNYTSLSDKPTLQSLLRLSNRRGLRNAEAGRDNERRIQGLKEISAHPSPMLLRRDRRQDPQGSPWAEVQGWNIAFELEEDHFTGDGDAYLFASVLREFFRLHASINTVVRVEAHTTTQGETFSWEPQSGHHIPF